MTLLTAIAVLILAMALMLARVAAMTAALMIAALAIPVDPTLAQPICCNPSWPNAAQFTEKLANSWYDQVVTAAQTQSLVNAAGD